MSMYGVAPPTNIRKFTINLPGIMALAAGIAVVDGDAAWQAPRRSRLPHQRPCHCHKYPRRVGDLAGRHVYSQPGCDSIWSVRSLPHPIPSSRPAHFIKTGAVLDPNRILVGSRSNFGAPLAIGVGAGGLVPVDRPERAEYPERPAEFRTEWVSGLNARRCRADVQREQSPLAQRRQQPGANTASYTGVSNPLGLSNNNAFGRLWPANAPFGDTGVGSSSILDPDGLPLKGAPSPVIGGVYVGSQTNRECRAVPQHRRSSQAR